MTTRQGRPSQVRPRPPSTGRPAPTKARSRAPAPGRLAAHRRVETTRRLALPFRLLFVAAVVSLCAGVLFVATGGVGKVADVLGSTLTGFVDDITSTPVPSVIPPSLADAPLIEKPDEPYTNQPKVDLVGTIPEGVAGIDGNRIRIYVAIGEGEPGVVTEIPVGRTVRFVVPDVTLADGANTFTATIVSDCRRVGPVAGRHVRPRHDEPADRREHAARRRRRQREDRLDRGQDAGPERGPDLERDDEPHGVRRRRRERHVRDRRCRSSPARTTSA